MSINNNRIDESVPQMVDVDIYLALLEEQCNNRYDAYRIILEKQRHPYTDQECKQRADGNTVLSAAAKEYPG